MNIDLGSPILDIAIGLSFVFFLLSLIASAVNEMIAGLLNLRGKTLKAGLTGMLGTATAADEVLDNGLVRTELDKESRKGANKALLWIESFLPRSWRNHERASSYLDPAVFAVAVRDLYNEGKEVAGATGKDLAPALVSQVKKLDANAVERLNRDAKHAITEAEAKAKALEKWFDSTMERVSGLYKRKSQIWLIVVALVVTVGLNANALRIAERLQNDPATRTAVVASAEKALTQEIEEDKEPEEAVAEIKAAGKHFTAGTKELTALDLPILWSGESNPSHATWEVNVFGWLLTIVAISLGAPFWFDALGKLSNLRSAGKKPEEAAKPA